MWHVSSRSGVVCLSVCLSVSLSVCVVVTTTSPKYSLSRWTFRLAVEHYVHKEQDFCRYTTTHCWWRHNADLLRKLSRLYANDTLAAAMWPLVTITVASCCCCCCPGAIDGNQHEELLAVSGGGRSDAARVIIIDGNGHVDGAG